MERKRKRELRDQNLRVWAGEKAVLDIHGSLDSSMKKNTAFIKRLRTAINAAGLSAFLQDIRTLSLHKYLSELISACFEGLCKLKTPGEIATGVEIVSALHQRFGPEEFTSFIGWHIGRGLSTPDRAQLKALSQDVREREERERVARQRVLLRVATELWLVGVLKSLEDVARPEEVAKTKEPAKPTDGAAKTRVNGLRSDQPDPESFPLEVLKDMLGHDRDHVNLPLVVVFVKAFAWDILGSNTSNTQERKMVMDDGATTNGQADSTATTEDDEASERDAPMIDSALRQRFKNILVRYFEDVKQHVQRDQTHLSAQGRRNAEAYVKSGEVFEDRQNTYEKQAKNQEKLISNAQVLADALGLDMPDMSEKDASASANDAGIGLVKAGEYLRGQTEGAGIWEDDEERRFYENLIDLKERVPGILLEDGKKKRTDEDDQVGKRAEEKPVAISETPEKWDANPAKPGDPDPDDQSLAIANKTVGAQVDALLARLVDLSTRDQIDQFAIDFCFLNSKASRNRLVKAIQEIPKGRIDLLPVWSRLVATLSKPLHDIPQAIVAYLDEEFRSLQRRKQKDFLGQVRMTNIRYIAELTKFGVVPEHVIFHCLKVSLDDFSRMNIEIISSLLENCGRYLLRNPDTSPRMTSFLETLQRKKTAHHLGQQERMLIENATYYVNPPQRAAIQQKERSPLDLYVRKLIYLDLSKRSLEKVIKQIRKLHWEEQEVHAILRKIFTRPDKIKYSNVHLLAVILGALHRYHQEFTISVMDEVLERITVGLESNDFRFNQKRTAEVKYLGELYTYRMVDSVLVFDTLYHILNYGHPGEFARPDSFCPIDMPDDFFRVRLVCSLLETCGMFFDKGTVKKKLDFFLAFFQYYLKTKDPMPMDVEFVVQDTFALLRPQLKIATNLEEASNAFAEACKQNYQNTISNKDVEPEEPEDAGASDDARGDGDVHAGAAEDDESSEDEDAEAGDDEEAAQHSEEEEQIFVTRPGEVRDPEAEADFDRELAKLMSESVESRKFDRKPVFDVPLPMRRSNKEATAPPVEEKIEPEVPPSMPMNTMKFALLSKRGNRQQTRSIDLPSDSNFAVAMRSQQEAERAEQQRIKSLVLNYDLSNDDNTDGDSSFPYVLRPYAPAPSRPNGRSILTGNDVLSQPLDFNNPGVRPFNQKGKLSSASNNKKQSGKPRGQVKQISTSALYSSQNRAPRRHAPATRELPPASTTAPLSAYMQNLRRPTWDAQKENGQVAEEKCANEPSAAALDAHASYSQPRIDKAGSNRNNQRARKLQLSDVDWT